MNIHHSSLFRLVLWSILNRLTLAYSWDVNNSVNYVRGMMIHVETSEKNDAQWNERGFGLVWFIVRPWQHDIGYIRSITDLSPHRRTTQFRRVRSSLVVIHPSTNRGRRASTSLNVPAELALVATASVWTAAAAAAVVLCSYLLAPCALHFINES